MQLSKKKVVLGLSGGVDSTVATLLLKEKGFEVIGCFLDVLGENNPSYEDAEKIAKELEIDFMPINVSERFSDVVIGNFCSEYRAGRTPNPCVVCNPNIKFKTLIDVANRVGAYYIATGHYAKIRHVDDRDKYFIEMSNSKKDQSYMMHRLGQEVLSRIIFPLGEFDTKEDVRSLAQKHRLSNATKGDSQEICFLEDAHDYIEYLSNSNVESPDGDFVDIEGNVLGRHRGIIHYTIGQRKGLGIAFGKPMFVVRIDAGKNQVVLGSNEELFTKEVRSRNNFFVETGLGKIPESLGDGAEVVAKIRYASKPARCKIYQEKEGILAIFSEPQRAASPGQSIVFYKDGLVVGGGVIFL